MRSLPTLRAILILLLASTAFTLQSAAYSVLSHEIVVDLVWTNKIEPLLREKFPMATVEDLRRAHAYTYGGCIIQDMGYYPFGNKEFSNLAHYVRSGDFVQALIRDAQDLNEYAFALGALAHYVSDIEGHPAVNQAVADMIPKLQQRYGRSVTYADDHKAHIRVEFGFDAAQVAKQRFAPDKYHNLIGFQVATPLLERAFRETYGLELKEIIKHVNLAIGSYRRAVSKSIPMLTSAAVATHRVDSVDEIHDLDRRKFIYRLSRAQYRQEWGTQYQRPGTAARMLAFVYHFVLKVGPLKVVDFFAPTPQTEDLYFKSMNLTVERYRSLLNQLHTRIPDLPNVDFDTGRPTALGEYTLTDTTYAMLLHKLADKHFQTLTPELRNNLLAFYQDAGTSFANKRDKGARQRTQQEINALKAALPGVQLSAVETPQ